LLTIMRTTRLVVAATLLLALAPPAARAGSSVAGWGDAATLGLGSIASTALVTPTALPGAQDATAAAVGRYGVFALTPRGVVASGAGYLGLGESSVNAPATLVPGTAGATAVAAGDEATLIVQAGGTVDAFGANGTGAAGGAVGVTRQSPAPVDGLSGVIAVAAGGSGSFALKADGTVWAWGDNDVLGNAAAVAGADTPTPVPVALPPGSHATAIAAGAGHALALLDDGSVWGWGANWAGQVGDGSGAASAEPVRVIAPPAPGTPRVTAISAGDYASFALLDDGTFRAWGYNGYGSLGLGNTATDVSVPTAPDPALVAALPDHYPPLTRLSAVGPTTFAVAAGSGVAGRVLAWGDNRGAGLGFGSDTATFDAPFPYPALPPGSDPGSYADNATEIPQRVGRLKQVPWLGTGSTGSVQVAATATTLQLSTGNVPFFTQPLNTVSARRRVDIASVDDPTTITSVRIGGPNAADFDLSALNTSGDASDHAVLPVAVAPNGTLYAYVRFIPTGEGERFATLQFSGGGETVSTQLSGFGAPLPGNTPGAKGASVTGPAGPAGATGPAGAAGVAGVPGKDGTVTFTTKKATTTVKRGRTATLSFSIKNATAGRLVATTATATLPAALTAEGGRTLTVPALAAGASRTVTLQIAAGRRVRPGTYTVRLRVPYGTRAVTASAKVKVVR
jgi:alpha-tubulin suppressor-like RCC1 family protein